MHFFTATITQQVSIPLVQQQAWENIFKWYFLSILTELEAESEEEDDDDDDDGKKVSGDITRSWASVIFSRHHLSLFVFSVLFSVLHIVLNVLCTVVLFSQSSQLYL